MTTAHETSDAFSDEVLKEHAVFELNKQQEMKEMLGRYADGQVEMLQRAMDDWDRVSAAREFFLLSVCVSVFLRVFFASTTEKKKRTMSS